MTRPHMNSSLADLTSMVDDPESTPELVAEVAEELRHRSTKGARSLLARLECRSVTPVSGREAQRPRDDRTPPWVDETSVIPTDTRVETEHSRDIATQFAALRATFTAESEILARWGLTSAMPDDMVRLVLEEWAGRLTDEPDGLGRSITSLSRDAARLAELGFWGTTEGQSTDGN